MVTAEALDQARWNIGCRRNGNGIISPVNLLSTLYVGLAAMDARLFRKLDKSELPVDPERFALIHALVDTINSWELAPRTAGDYGRALLRFVIWADRDEKPLSRITIVALLASYCEDSSARIDSIRRAASEGLALTGDECNLLFPSTVQPVLTNDDWVLTLETQPWVSKPDFLRFVIPGDAALPTYEFAEKRQALQAATSENRSGRAELVRAMRNEFRSLLTAKSLAPRSLETTFRHVRQFVVWVDDQKLALNKDSAIEALVAYSQHLTRKCWAGALSASSRMVMLQAPTRILAEVTDRQPFEIRLQLTTPPLRDSGLTSVRPSAAQVQEFCANLHAIVRALPSDVLSAPIHAQIQVKLSHGSEAVPSDLPEPLGGYGDRGYDPRLANIKLLNLRIWAEMHRFIAFTGCNVSVAQNLTIREWTASGQLIEALKGRANKYVSVRTNRMYQRHVDAHIEFLKAAAPVPIDDDTPLFPDIFFLREARGLRAQRAALRAGTAIARTAILLPTKGWGAVSWARDHGLKLTPRQLRQAKATWVLRRYSGDLLRVARALGNKPGVAFKHYGGKGNLEQAIVDWSAFWDSPLSQSALAPGNCRSPGLYEPVLGKYQPAGSCEASACLGCRQYRGEDSLDYVHAILSYQYCLSYRAPSNSEIAPLIEIIDWIIDAYLKRNVDHHKAVEQLRAQISDRPHPRFDALTRLMEIIHAS